MSERDPEQLRQAVSQAAELVQGLPENLQAAAFNKVFDALLGSTQASSAASISPAVSPQTPRALTPTRTGISGSAPSADEDRVAPLLHDIDRTLHPNIRSGRSATDLAVMTLRAAEECSQPWLTPAEIARLLRDKFRVSVTDVAVRMALGRAGALVDRRPLGSGYEYRLMDEGERYIDSLGVEDNAGPQGIPRARRTPRRRSTTATRRGSARNASLDPTGNTDATAATASDLVNEPSERVGDAAEANGDGRSVARSRGRNNGRPGPKQVLEQLLDAGFFDTPRTMGEIATHVQQRRAITFGSPHLGPTLVRLVREQRLERELNAENQYAYKRVE